MTNLDTSFHARIGNEHIGSGEIPGIRSALHLLFLLAGAYVLVSLESPEKSRRGRWGRLEFDLAGVIFSKPKWK